jgi:hypothetical protein
MQEAIMAWLKHMMESSEKVVGVWEEYSTTITE